MKTNRTRRLAVAALVAAGLLWGTTVPLSKLALDWLSPGWLTVARFGLAAAVLLAVARGRGLRLAFTPRVLAAGALGYGGSVLLQNAGIGRTSVTHAALLIGAVPVLVAIIAAVWHRAVARPVAWAGFVLSLAGVGLVTAGGGGGGATPAGDGLVLASLLLSATVTVAQGRLLAGRDPVAVTAVQFLGAALGAFLVTAVSEGGPAVPGSAGPVLAVAALAGFGTLAPFTLFAFGQSRVPAQVAGAFLNLEPLVGALVGVVAFGDPAGLAQAAGGAAILAGIGLSSLPLLAGRRRPVVAAAAAEPVAVTRAVEAVAVTEAARQPTVGVAGPSVPGNSGRLAPASAREAGPLVNESDSPPERGVSSKSHISPGDAGRRHDVPPSRLEPARCSTEPARTSGGSRSLSPARGCSGASGQGCPWARAAPGYCRWGASRVRSAGDRRSRAVLAWCQ